jgi:hypothetical protein
MPRMLDNQFITDTGELRTVGEVKPSYNWSSAWSQQPPESNLHCQYRQAPALAQLHYYISHEMEIHGELGRYLNPHHELKICSGLCLRIVIPVIGDSSR